LLKGKRDKALRSLRRMNGGVPGYDVERELEVLIYNVNGQRALEAEQASTSFLEIFRKPNLRRTLVSTSIMSWQQCLVSRMAL
jgi:hypothetical protein